MRKESLTYEDVLRIVELVKTTRFSEFRLKVGEIEVHLRRKNGSGGETHAQHRDLRRQRVEARLGLALHLRVGLRLRERARAAIRVARRQ